MFTYISVPQASYTVQNVEHGLRRFGGHGRILRSADHVDCGIAVELRMGVQVDQRQAVVDGERGSVIADDY